jgi:hypothetical protein
MRLRAPAEAESYDAVFLSPHVDDAPIACAARLLGERELGARVLLVVACGDPAEAVPGTGWPAAFERWRVDLLPLGLPDAAEREPAYGSLRALAFERRPSDDAAVAALAVTLEDLRQRVRARDVYLPLGVGGHADHRLVLEAALRVFTPGVDRNVFLYEERPATLLPGALRLRLGQLGAWLPPGTGALDDPGLARLLLRFQREAYLACGPSPWAERVRCSGLVARQWREARGWRPQRGLGLRLQPVLHVADETLLAGVREAGGEWAARRAAVSLPLARLERLAAAYAQRLGGGVHAERYWLLLPPRDEDARYGPLGRLADEALAS